MTASLNISLTIRLHKAAGDICLRLHEYQEALRLYTFLLSEARRLHPELEMVQHSFEDDLQLSLTFADLFFSLA